MKWAQEAIYLIAIQIATVSLGTIDRTHRRIETLGCQPPVTSHQRGRLHIRSAALFIRSSGERLAVAGIVGRYCQAVFQEQRLGLFLVRIEPDHVGHERGHRAARAVWHGCRPGSALRAATAVCVAVVAAARAAGKSQQRHCHAGDQPARRCLPSLQRVGPSRSVL